jgi:two-component system response regulator DegU
MKYLIIDDNPDMQKLIRQEVCSEEDCVVECSDGEGALDFYSKHLPDYVLMDIKMNKVNGIAATKMIIDKFPFARIIIITDYDKRSFRQAAKRVGAIAFFSKENLFEVKNYINNKFLSLPNN